MRQTVIGKLLAACSTLAVLAACGSPEQIVVASKDNTEQRILGEIVAQLVERRMGLTVGRRLGLGNSQILYQAMLTGEANIYPEYAGVILYEFLKETPGADPTVTFERARLEMARVGQMELLPTMGFDSRTVIVVRAAENPSIETLDDAETRDPGWKLGVSRDFQTRDDGLRILRTVRLPMEAAVRGMREDELFPAMLPPPGGGETGDEEEALLSMIAATATDGHLMSEEWKILEDEHGLFPPQPAGILARQEILAAYPELRAVLEELSGRIDQATMRGLNAEVDVEGRSPAEVAAEFVDGL